MAVLGFIIIFILIFGFAKSLVWAQTAIDRQLPQDTTSPSISDQILDRLPQTQCAQCSYPGCAPYAAAVAEGENHNKCPPGGQALVDELGDLLNRPTLILESTANTAITTPPEPIELVAIIREEDCIGCAKCGPACPVDAIVGASKMMHTVILQDCTGCELCLPPCPVDCIDLVPRQAIL